MQPRIRYGMAGGGQGAFIGAVHRMAARMDDQYELVCGAFSSTAAKSLASGVELGVAPERAYADFNIMFEREAALPADKRMQCVVIVTPNRTHLAIAGAALDHGFHVLSDKPATSSLVECRVLAAHVRESGLHYGLTHPYTAYPMVREAQARVASGALGKVRKVLVEYTQGWLAEPIEHHGNKQARWRLDPTHAGISSCMADIGVHAFNLAEFVTALEVRELCASLNKVVPGRKLDDDGTVLLRFGNGASGVLMASQVCIGDENNIRLRVYGEKASLDWQQMEPNSLWFRPIDAPAQLLRTGATGTGTAAAAATRIPSGHPEGFLEAFGNVYREFAQQLRSGGKPGATHSAVPGIHAALRGMAFIEGAVASSAAGTKWQALPKVDPMKGPGIFLAQFAGDKPPFNSLEGMARWAASLGYVGVQVPTSDPALFDIKLAAGSQTYCDEIKGKLAKHGIEISELSTHLQGQLMAVHPAYVEQFKAFADPAVRDKPASWPAWATGQLICAAQASKRLGLKAHATFSGALLWPQMYPWPQRPAGLVEMGFAELASRWRPVLDAFSEAGVALCYEIHPGEDLHDGVTFERFLDAVGGHAAASILYDPSHFVLQQLDYLAFIDHYHDRIKAFHVKDAEFRPNGKAGVYGGYQNWVDRPGRFRSPGDGQIDFTGIFSKFAQYGYEGWAVLEWECALKHPEDGAREGAPFIARHMIRTTDKAFDDFAATGSDTATNEKILGL